ncbi:MAG: branched-chain amino acid aminotransferase [Bdellovibrionales bacterium]|nr:branched-chain amino acid aminotransferase [Bdellovibrionales bacterium]
MPEIQRRTSPTQKPIPPAKDLKFGQHFSDHWFWSKYSEGKGWFESRIEPYGPLALDPAASVFHYGQALFEGMKAFRRANGEIGIFRPEFNHSRMCDGAARLCLEAPPKELFMQGLKQLIQVDERWVPSDEGCSLYIRPTLIGTEGFLGVRPSREYVFFILLSPAAAYYSGGNQTVKIWVEDKALRAAPGGLGATKAGANYAASLQAGLEAKRRGYAQVLWLDVQHEGIEEVGTMNVFFVLKDEIVTPALNGSILPGCMRDSALRLLREQGAKVSERRITISEVAERHARGELLEAFGTGTAAVISPIGELNLRGNTMVIHGHEPGPVAQNLQQTLIGIQRGTVADKFGWMKTLEQL